MAKRVSFAAALALLIFGSAPATDWIVNKVVTGESFISVEHTVRLKGVDAPPAEESRQHLEELIGGAAVTVTGKEDYDQQGRWWVYLNGPDGRDVGAMMIRDGYALADRRESHPKLDEYTELEREAKRAGVGLWANPGNWTLSDSILRNDPTSTGGALGALRDAPTPTTDPNFPVYVGDFLYHLAGCALLPDDPNSMSYLKPDREDLLKEPIAFAVIEGFQTCEDCGAPELDTTNIDMQEIRRQWEIEYLPGFAAER